MTGSKREGAGREPDAGDRGAAPGIRALAVACLAVAAAGCALLSGKGPAGGGGTAAADTSAAGADTAAETAAAPEDTTRGRALPSDTGALADARVDPADSAYRALLDSARNLARGGQAEPAAQPEADTAADDREESEAAAEDGYPAGPVTVTDVEKLEELGPVYTPYDRGPTLMTRAERLDGLLKATLVPVIQRHELPPDEWARYWVLVDAEGEVRATTLQLPSGHASFDEAARAVAENLRFAPAHRNDQAVPVWILTRISLLMR